MPTGLQTASIGPAGLSAAEASARLTAEGFNELQQTRSRSVLRLIADVLKEPMLALLLAGAGIYLLLGDHAEAILLGVFASASIVITIVQEARTERVLESLRDLSSPRALVIRDSEQMRIAGREVVRGDLIVLTEGDRVAADAVLRQCDDLLTDESLLTGESVPVRKRAAASEETVASQAAGGDDQPLVFSSSLVVRGTGLAEVTATGPHTAIGRIGQAVTAVETETPRLQQQTTRLVTAFAIGGGIVVAITVVLYAMYRGGWLDGVLAGIALGMSMLPEEFPLVLTVFMAMGAWRISQARVLTRRASAIESLGAATVLCTDKTGTLTQNRMTVASLMRRDGAVLSPAAASPDAVTPDFRDLVATAVLACDPQSHDPMEKALQAIGAEIPGETLLRRYGLRPELLAMTNVWSSGGGEVVAAAKGAPEAIAGLCGITGAALSELQAQVEAMAAGGLRVLGIAWASWDDAELPESQQAFPFTFCGLAGFADPLRPEVPAAVAECRSAGIRIIMITGDYPATAATIARQAGITPERIITGPELAALDDAALARATRTPTAFARIMPEQKLRIVDALKADGEIVAMTGDGVNDAPSLKSAHIGIAMGGRGTDVAREASAIVLLDDDFGSIVKAIRLGRRIYDNLRKAMCFILAVHFPIAGLALLPLVTGLPLLLGPVHIAFLEMIIDPVCSLVFEAEIEEHDVMQRPPRDPQEPLLPRALVLWGALQGLLALLATSGVLLMASRAGMPEDEVRALVFFALVFVIVSLVFVNRSFSSSLREAFTRPNRVLLLVIAIVAAVLATSLTWPVAAALFRFGPLHADDLAVTVGAGFATLIVLELSKFPLRAALTRRAAKPPQVNAASPLR
ncbi:ATPase [Bradyrhizobium sp. SSBR45G]|uniref:cation-translocating P-type ATPase n=1 Tax=unclassified Bradyrhizobium TaxID=2631580 RepID=UPI0023429535|nr:MULTISPECIES: cation-translocating P-type ATPase [unclassified Bradyrhizobium]GLH82359.1 ATPase [Bradyrhizobium sp. SSBR45G]GLH89792.1 ATPase [Bradyrhizobium sp. SSBR45R]